MKTALCNSVKIKMAQYFFFLIPTMVKKIKIKKKGTYCVYIVAIVGT